MVISKVKVNGVCAETLYCKPIPKGIIGAQVEFEYTDPMWDNLTKTVVFRGSVYRDILNAQNIVTIPAEVVSTEGCWLSVGVYGVDPYGVIVIPTIWAELGIVRDAADPSGDTSAKSTLPVWAQIQNMIGNMNNLNTISKETLVDAINEILDNGGEIDPETIAAAVAEYIRNNPIAETDPTVPAWAKAENKPEYTAEEVGALSADALPGAIDQALAQVKESGEFDGADGAPGADGYTPVKGTDYFTDADKQEIAEQAAGLVSIPNKLPNPNALTFTGAVTGSYDGSAPLSVEIPQGGGGGASVEKQWRLLNTVTLTEPVSAIEILTDSDGNPFEISEFAVYAPLGVVASENSQLFIGVIEPGAKFDDTNQTYTWQKISSTANSFVGTNRKSILIKSDWVGGRYTVCTSGTYDVDNVSLTVGTVRFSRDSMKYIGGVKIYAQYSSVTFNDGTFYLYGR